MVTLGQVLYLAKDMQSMVAVVNPVYFVPDYVKADVEEQVARIIEIQARARDRNFEMQQGWVLEVGSSLVADTLMFRATLDETCLKESTSMFHEEQLCEEAESAYSKLVGSLTEKHAHFTKYLPAEVH